MKRLGTFGLGLLLVILTGCSATKSLPTTYEIDRFESEIKAFEIKDAVTKYQPGAVLFTGSSSIRLWQSLGTDMGDIPSINRGFGGSTIPEVNHYYDRIVSKFQPSVIVLYCGENDITAERSAEQVVSDFKSFVKRTKKELPETPIIYLSMKPSPSRWQHWQQFEDGNQQIEKMADKNPLLYYVDVGEVMMGENKEPDKSIFIVDMLHMNKEGYRRWTAHIKPIVESVYQSRQISD